LPSSQGEVTGKIFFTGEKDTADTEKKNSIGDLLGMEVGK